MFLSRKIINLIYVIMILAFSEAFSDQTCGSVTNCPNKRYKYRFCNDFNRQLVELCERDPNNVSGFTPMKSPIPICFEFENRAGEPTIIELATQVGAPVEVFDISKVQNDIDNAQYGWNCLCGKQNDECVCIIKAKFISDNSKWPIGVSKQSVVVSKVEQERSSGCRQICPHQNAVIFLNNLPGFKQKLFGSRMRSFSNQEYLDNDPEHLDQIKPGLITYNLTDVMYKAIGWQYGLPTQSGDVQCNPPYEGRMKGFTINQGSKGLSRDDKCMFKKLYCPSLTPVEDEYVEETGDVENFPNPFDNKTYFSFLVPEEGCYVTITVYNQIGNVVAVPLSKQYNNPGQQNEIFDASELPSGFYYYTIQLGREIKTNKMIVSR